MSKNAPAPIAAPAPAAAPAAQAPAPAPAAPKLVANKLAPQEVKVIKWEQPADTGGPFADVSAAETSSDAAPAADGDAPAEQTEAPEQEAAPAEGEPQEQPETDAAEQEAKAEETKPKARSIIERVKAEKAKREAEAAAATARQEAAELRRQLNELGSVKVAPLAKRLEFLGITTEEQRQQFILDVIEGRDTVIPAPAPEPKVDDRVKALEEKLARAEQERLEAVRAQAAQQVQQATENLTQGIDLTVTRAVTQIAGDRDANGEPQGMALIMAVAQQMWEQAGKPARHDFVQQAAHRVEAHYRSQERYKPLIPNQTTQALARKPNMGQKIGPKPGTVQKPLPRDRHERDELIKREFGMS